MPRNIRDFITYWQAADGSERGHMQQFLNELIEVLGLPKLEIQERLVAPYRPAPPKERTAIPFAAHGVSSTANTNGEGQKASGGVEVLGAPAYLAFHPCESV